MTTPRVTVPVEDLLFYKLKDLILEQSEGEWTDEMIVRDAHHFANHIRPLLSASPAPEGGAVPDDALAVAVGRLTWAANTHPDAEKKALLTQWAEECQAALAAREEAPAEAGALVSQIDALLAIPEANLSSRIPYLARELLERSAKHLRAQPQARDDAQPVGRAVEMCGSAGKTSMGIFDAAVVPVGSPLYTHPAPDALRAIEMLRASEGDSVTILCDNPEATDLDDAMAVVCCGPWTDWKDCRFYGRDVADALSKALAALQAEQKGGA